MRRILIVLLLLLPGLCGAGTLRAGEHPWNDKRIYYVIEFMGQMIEKGYFIRRVGSYQKIDCWVIDEEKSFYAAGNPATPLRTINVRTWSTFDGVALQRLETIEAGGQGSEKIIIDKGDARFESTGAYGSPTRVAVPPDVLFEVTGEWLAAHKLLGGRTYTANVLDRASRGVVASEVIILEKELEQAPDAPSVWLAEILTAGRQTVVARYTDDGRLLRLEGGGMTYQVVPREAYEIGRIPGMGRVDVVAGAGTVMPGSPADPTTRMRSTLAGTAVIPIGMGVPAWDSFGWLRFRAEPSFEWSNVIRNSEYVRMGNVGSWVELTAVANAPFVDQYQEFPLNLVPELNQFLDSSPLIPSTHPAIIEAAHVAVSDVDTGEEETNVVRALSYLAGWINQSVRVEDWRGYDSGALETLAARSGDSLGHARLFAAMARTFGIPTRVCQGFLVFVNRAVNHCWAEAWINRVWVPVDTTVSRVGLPAGYVLVERGDGSGALRVDFAHFMRNPALNLSLVSAGRETPGGQAVELVVGDRRTYAVTERDWLANLYWGFALRLPRGWRGEAKLNSVELRSDDGRARVKCEALEGDFSAGEAELTATIASLRESLSRFSVREAEVGAFDEDGATPLLFVDFTCVEGRVGLRCRQYVIPRRQRAFRVSFWAPESEFGMYEAEFDRILTTFEF